MAEVETEAQEKGIAVPAEALGRFTSLLAQAKASLVAENYKEAKQLAKQAQDTLENVEEAIEQLEEEKEKLEEQKEEEEEKQKEEE